MFKQDQLPKLTPWITWDDWLEVYQGLYAFHAPQLQQLAIKRVRGLLLDHCRKLLKNQRSHCPLPTQIAAWKSRQHIPVAVESTSNLIEMSLKDNETRSDNEKQSNYAMTIARFVNGVTEPFQKQSHAQSIGAIAARIGLPSGLVDLRHQVSHQQLPPLPLLRIAARQSLGWLQEHYWQAQHAHLGNSKLQTLEKLIRWKKLSKSLFKAQKTDRRGLHKQLKTLKQDILDSTTVNQVSLNLVPLLIHDDFLVPNLSKKLKKFEKIPEKVWKMWAKLVDGCTAQWEHFLPTLMSALIDALIDSEFATPQLNVRIYRRSMFYCWFVKLLEVFYQQSTTQLRKHFDSADEDDDEAMDTSNDEAPAFDISDLPVLALLDTCLKIPSQESVQIAKLLVSYIQGQPEFQKFSQLIASQMHALSIDKLEKAKASDVALAKTTVGASLMAHNSTDGDDSLDLDQLEKQVASLENRIFYPSAVNEEESIWQLVPNPPRGFGVTPTGEVPDLKLPLELDTLQKAAFLLPARDLAAFTPTQGHQPPDLRPDNTVDFEEPMEVSQPFGLTHTLDGERSVASQSVLSTVATPNSTADLDKPLALLIDLDQTMK